MSLVLEGTVNGMRPVSGEISQGKKNAGSYYHFLSLEVCDSRFGQVYSCQVRPNDKDLFAEYVKIGPGKDKDGKPVGEVGTLLKDLTGHNVKILMKGVSAGERTIGDKATGAEETILQVRFYVSAIKDLGKPKTDDF